MIKRNKSTNLAASRGLPYRYAQNGNGLEFKFGTILYERGTHVKQIRSSTQEEWFEKLCEELPNNSIIGISSEPTDELAMKLASILFMKSIKRGEYVTISDSSSIIPNDDSLLKASFVYNITDKIDIGRIIKIRDVLVKQGNSGTVILVIGGIDAYSFFNENLRHPIDIILHPTGYKLTK